jgi:radical SAM/Cys-rich protein
MTKIKELCQYPIQPEKIEILQLNIIKKCNLQCKHCHVEAGPERIEKMSHEILNQCLRTLTLFEIDTVDITGGAPELHSDLPWFISEASKITKRVIIRSNLVILNETPYHKYFDFYAKNNIELCASLPDYTGSKADIQRGKNFFNNSIDVIQKLNKMGYGKKDTGLVLNFVYNPVGAYLPGNQAALEYEFKSKLKKEYDIDFNNLFCITNMPIGRFLEYLERTDNIEDYFSALLNSYNKESIFNVMCKNTLNIGWDGRLYNCDFNQMLDMPIAISDKENILELGEMDLRDREILVHNHCFGCTAGEGSSCQGITVSQP